LQIQPEPGRLILDEPIDVYYQRRLDVANASGLKIIEQRSCAHFHHAMTDPEGDKDTPAKAFGRAFHCAILEPNEFGKRYVVLPEDAPDKPTERMLNAMKRNANSQARIDYWHEWEIYAQNRTTLVANDYERAQRMGESVRKHPIASGLILSGHREATFRWTDERTGLQCKMRADYFEPEEFILDVKSAENASKDGFARAITNYLYDLAAAHYVDGVTRCGQRIRRFIFLACEHQPPYVCQPYILDVMAEQRGWALRERAIGKLAQCVQTGHWPAYSDTVEEITLPAWAFFGIDQ
jgi:hypothetical protein